MTTRKKTPAEILQALREGLDIGVAPPEIFGDPDLHHLELEQIFGRVWVFVAFESEIPAVGDFVVRSIGEDRFIIIKGEDEQIRALLDRCSHRGAQVCRSERGNANGFVCPYHGWSYNSQGDLVGVPLRKQAYGTLDMSGLGLRSAPRVDTVHGMIFVSLEANGPTLDDWLGDTRWYLDTVFGIFEGGMEVIGEPQRWLVDANWKVGGDNFVGDDYHTLALHGSMFQLAALPIDPIDNMKGYHIQLDNGHGVSFSMPDVGDPVHLKFWGYPEEIVATMRRDALSAAQWDYAQRSRVSVGTIFPNLSFLTLPAQASPDAPYCPFMSVRQWQPRGAQQMEALSWMLVPKGASQKFRDNSYAAGISTFGSAGTFEQDDTVPWTHITRGAQSVAARCLGAQLNYQLGMPGHGVVRDADEWEGPGKAVYPRWEEGNQRNYLRAYYRFMSV